MSAREGSAASVLGEEGQPDIARGAMRMRGGESQEVACACGRRAVFLGGAPLCVCVYM